MPVSTPCPSVMKLHDFSLGLTTEDESHSIEEHLLHCDTCSHQLTDETVTDTLVTDLRAKRNEPKFPIDDQVIKIQHQLHASIAKIATKISLIRDVSTHQDASSDGHLLQNEREARNNAPAKISHYYVKEKLGSGGTGVVYRAWDQKLGRDVALKLILDQKLLNPLHIERFTSEAETLARLQHPNIVQIFEIGEEQGHIYLALEYLEGGDLASLVRGQPQHPEDSARLMIQLAKAVHYAHMQGIIHRDLKPANVLIEAKSIVNWGSAARPLANITTKIADFGLAKHMELPGKTVTGVILGTPSYMAPECLNLSSEKLHYDPRVDVYSLGAVLYELLTGRPPVRGETVAETLVLAQVATPLAPRKLRPGLPRDLETICMHCLEKEPGQRYATAQEFVNDLERYLNLEPITARPASLLERTIKWTRRRPALAILACLLLITVLTLITGAFTYERRLQSALKKTEAERDRADRNYQQARDALEHMLAKLDDPRRTNIPQLQQLRREQQVELVKFLQTVVSHTSDDPQVMRDIAHALYTSARLKLALGQSEGARQDLLRSNELISSMLVQSPSDISLRKTLTSNFIALATTYPYGPDFLRYQETAASIQTALLQEQPDDDELQKMHATTLHNIGAHHLVSNKLEKAETCLLRALSIHDQRIKKMGISNDIRINYAESALNLNLLYVKLDQPAKAEQYYRQSLEMLESVLKEQPDNMRVLVGICGLRINRANSLFSITNPEPALNLLDANVRDLKALLQREPQFIDARRRLYETQGTRGNALASLGQFLEAATAYRDVVEMSTPEEKRFHRVLLSYHWARAGKYRSSIESAAESKQDPPDGVHQKVHLACSYCINLKSITRDQGLSAQQKSELVQICQHAASYWLNQARQQANSEEWSHLIHALKSESLWLPLRQNQAAWDLVLKPLEN